MNIILVQKDIRNLSVSFSVSINEIFTLIAHILQKEYTDVFFRKEIELTESQQEILLSFLKRRSLQEPLAKILQRKEFYGISYKTSKSTLDPRPETELIVDLFQKYFPEKTQKLQILDLGSGTGCIGLTILSLYNNSHCEFVDISEEALEVCSKNAKELNLIKRCKFNISNWFLHISGKFDVIVSNPPYISEEYKLDKEVLYDPEQALFAGKDGLDAYRQIIPNLKDHLKCQGLAILEIGYDQKESVLALNNDLTVIETMKDLGGNDRIIVFADCKIT